MQLAEPTIMKSSKQRRDEIKAKRLERAARLAAQFGKQEMLPLQAQVIPPSLVERSVPGMVPVDRDVLVRHNNSYSLPSHYLDRAFICRDCGAQEVWTAKQQKWWYEVIHAPIDSLAVRCLACRRARRTQKAALRAASPLVQQAARLRALGEQPPTAEAQAEVEAALQSKWWSLRTVAIETLGRWGGPRQIAQLQAMIAAKYEHKPQVLDDGTVVVDAPAAYQRRNWARAAVVAAEKALHPHRQNAP